eukprot:3546065-Alexandrium_andersonii.AAC.1
MSCPPKSERPRRTKRVNGPKHAQGRPPAQGRLNGPLGGVPFWGHPLPSCIGGGRKPPDRERH